MHGSGVISLRKCFKLRPKEKERARGEDWDMIRWRERSAPGEGTALVLFRTERSETNY